MAARLAEAEETISALHDKLAALEKSKVKLSGELDDVSWLGIKEEGEGGAKRL